MVNKIRTWSLVAVVVWTLLMLYLLLSPVSPGGGLSYFEGQDKVVHFTLFSVWCFLLSLVTDRSNKISSLTITLILGSSLVFAISTEWVQYYLPGRSGDWIDGLCDMAGSAFGLIVAHFLKKELIRVGKELDK
ncbi:MAG: VanZ family protein [Marinoscillum sp.]